jgi:acetylornithine/succinyldiaminopimelate/putrescine aminotransferase
MNQRQLFLKHIAQTSDIPMSLEIDHAEGMYLYDVQGKAYMDLIAGIGVSSLGHCHPKVVEAVQQQAAKYMHTMVYGEFILSPQVQLAEKLAATLPDSLDNVYFTNSGAEACEGALKLAKRYTGRAEIVSMQLSYHGSTHGALSLMSDSYFTAAFRPLLPQVRHIQFNHIPDLQQITTQTACVIVETVRAEVGIHKPEQNYLKQLRERCDAVGALLIFDEIQAGFGRTGSLYAFEQYGVVPDILLLAKGFGGGMPIGAFIASQQVMHSLSHDPVLGHITTFGGHPVSCAAALATLTELLDNKVLIASIPAKEQLFLSRLVHPKIISIHHAGLWFAVEIEGGFDAVLQLIQLALAEGLIIDWFLFNNRSIRIAPPLIISEAEINQACDILLRCLDKL